MLNTLNNLFESSKFGVTDYTSSLTPTVINSSRGDGGCKHRNLYAFGMTSKPWAFFGLYNKEQISQLNSLPGPRHAQFIKWVISYVKN